MPATVPFMASLPPDGIDPFTDKLSHDIRPVELNDPTV